MVSSLVADEIEALSSIYGSDFVAEDINERIYSIKITNKSNSITLRIKFPCEYSKTEKIEAYILDQSLSKSDSKRLKNIINEIISNNEDEPIGYSLIDQSLEFLRNLETSKPELPPTEIISVEKTDAKFISVPSVAHHLKIFPHRVPGTENTKLSEIFIGEKFVDKKSIFIASCMKCERLEEVSAFISHMLTDKEVRSATHNITAWFINESIYGADDDGESKASNGLLQLLDLSKARNIVVMVSRWFGGIKLGPDRFKDINMVAKKLLSEKNFIMKK